jgi:1,4-dihydroxy-2-naphthoate octaprenyltransferase
LGKRVIIVIGDELDLIFYVLEVALILLFGPLVVFNDEVYSAHDRSNIIYVSRACYCLLANVLRSENGINDRRQDKQKEKAVCVHLRS